MIALADRISGYAYPFGMANCDTDIIIAAEWLKTIERSGLGRGAFAAVRQDPANVFDDPKFARAPILIAGDNFGCGSSREHAAWALADMGITVVIAPSFSDIFSGNAFKNGILTVALSHGEVEQLLRAAREGEIHVDLAEQRVVTAGGEQFGFAIDDFRKYCLMNGLDEISLTLQRGAEIGLYEVSSAASRTWQAKLDLSVLGLAG